MLTAASNVSLIIRFINTKQKQRQGTEGYEKEEKRNGKRQSEEMKGEERFPVPSKGMAVFMFTVGTICSRSMSACQGGERCEPPARTCCSTATSTMTNKQTSHGTHTHTHTHTRTHTHTHTGVQRINSAPANVCSKVPAIKNLHSLRVCRYL